MTHDDAFLQAIIEKPDDDGPRLVYADWLEEHSQSERAEFIRVQCDLARLPEDDRRRDELGARERELLKEHEDQWAGRLRGWVNAMQFRRGFVEDVTVRPESFLEHAAALFQAAPVRRVHFQTAMFQLARPHLVVHRSASPHMERLAACPHLARLAAVSFRQSFIGGTGVETLAASPHLARLADLDLTLNGVGDRGVQALAVSPTFARLATLKLASNGVDYDGARALAASRNVTWLSLLDLGENPLGDEGVQSLAASPNLRRLATLGLARSGLGTPAARALAASPHLARLKSLDVRDNAIGNKARQALRLRFGKGKCRF